MKQYLRKMTLFISMLLLIVPALQTTPVQSQTSGTMPQDEVLSRDDFQFGLMDDSQAWVAMDGELYITSDATKSWQKITPDQGLQGLYQIAMHKNGTGTIVSVTPNDEMVFASVLQTNNDGKDWKELESNLQFALGDSHAGPIGQLYSQWLSPQEGWLMAKKTSSSQFSQGVLLVTKDGGAHWTAMPSPNGERFTFLDAKTGFMVNHEARESFFYTLDGGKSWQEYIMASMPLAQSNFFMRLPVPLQSGGFLLPMEVQFDEGGRQVGFIYSNAFSLNIKVDKQFQVVTSDLSGNASQLAVAGRLVPLGMAIERMSFLSQKQAWALFEGGACEEIEGMLRCNYIRELKKMTDGGKGWQAIQLPNGKPGQVRSFSVKVASDEPKSGSDDTQPSSLIGVFTGQAFDAAEIPTLAQLANWFTNSPYRGVNLYIGGISRLKANAALNEAYINEIARQGWRLIPTWVGHQAPCTTLRYPMPWDVNAAYALGVENANQAKTRMGEFGLLDSSGKGGLVYLDMEHFDTSNAACVAATNAFIRGWTVRLNQLGSVGALYATASNMNKAKMYNIVPPPPAVWIAAWNATRGYDPNASPYGLTHLPDGYWNHQQRIRQYSGHLTETWGGVGISIDPNVADGKVMKKTDLPPSVPTVSARITGEKGLGDWYKTQVNVFITAVDYSHGIDKIYRKIDNAEWKIYQPFGVNGSGKHTVSYYAVNKAGVSSAVKTISFYVDNQPPVNPTVSIIGCEAINGVPQARCNDAHFGWNGAFDAGVGLDPENTYQVYWGANPAGTSTSTQATPTYNAPPIPQKTPYYLRVRTQDKHGIWSAWQTIFTLIYDPAYKTIQWYPTLRK